MPQYFSQGYPIIQDHLVATFAGFSLISCSLLCPNLKHASKMLAGLFGLLLVGVRDLLVVRRLSNCGFPARLALGCSQILLCCFLPQLPFYCHRIEVHFAVKPFALVWIDSFELELITRQREIVSEIVFMEATLKHRLEILYIQWKVLMGITFRIKDTTLRPFEYKE